MALSLNDDAVQWHEPSHGKARQQRPLGLRHKIAQECRFVLTKKSSKFYNSWPPAGVTRNYCHKLRHDQQQNCRHGNSTIVLFCVFCDEHVWSQVWKTLHQYFQRYCLFSILQFLQNLWCHRFSNLHNRKTSISSKRKMIFQKGKCHSHFFWRAFQISCNYFSFHRLPYALKVQKFKSCLGHWSCKVVTISCNYPSFSTNQNARFLCSPKEILLRLIGITLS